MTREVEQIGTKNGKGCTNERRVERLPKHND